MIKKKLKSFTESQAGVPANTAPDPDEVVLSGGGTLDPVNDSAKPEDQAPEDEAPDNSPEDDGNDPALWETKLIERHAPPEFIVSKDSATPADIQPKTPKEIIPEIAGKFPLWGWLLIAVGVVIIFKIFVK